MQARSLFGVYMLADLFWRAKFVLVVSPSSPELVVAVVCACPCPCCVSLLLLARHILALSGITQSLSQRDPRELQGGLIGRGSEQTERVEGRKLHERLLALSCRAVSFNVRD